MKRFGKIVGLVKLGNSGYTKYTFLSFGETGIYGFWDSLQKDSGVSFDLGDFVSVNWSRKYLSYSIYPLESKLFSYVDNLFNEVKEW